MALTNYSTLQTAVTTWLRRSGDTDFSSNIVDIVALAEARLNRELGAIEADATLTGSVGSRRISLSAVSWVTPIALFLVDSNGDERKLQKQADGAHPYAGASGEPETWSMDGDNIDFDCPLGTAYSFRFRYRQKFNLATTSTNWLLTNHPDIYLAACLVWGAGFNEDVPNYMYWKDTLDEGIPSVRNIISQRNRGTLRVDPALLRRHSYNWVTDN